MSQNWMRHFELRLLNKDGKGIVVSDLKATFEIDWFPLTTMNKLGVIRVYNLSPNTTNQILGREFDRVQLIAGYQDNHGLIFSGEIIYTATGRENPVDTYVVIQAGDTDYAYISTMTSKTLPAGWTAEMNDNALMDDFKANGVKEGRKPEMPPTVFPRGKVLHGMTRDLMLGVAKMCRAHWEFVDGQRVMMRDDEYTHDPVILNSNCGLVGMPQQRLNGGVNVRTLINPNIRMNGQIQINEAEVYRAEMPSSAINMNIGPDGHVLPIIEKKVGDRMVLDGTPVRAGSIAADGVYVVRGILYRGDTRGQNWYMDMACEAVGAHDLKVGSDLDAGG